MRSLILGKNDGNYFLIKIKEPLPDKTHKMAWVPSEDSDQPGNPPSLIAVFAVRMKNDWVLSYPLSAQRRLWSDWADAQADLSLRWAHMPFCWFCREAAQKYKLRYLYFESWMQCALDVSIISGKPNVHPIIFQW